MKIKELIEKLQDLEKKGYSEVMWTTDIHFGYDLYVREDKKNKKVVISTVDD